MDRLDPPLCKAARHGLGEAFPGCRCFCNERLCHSKRKVLYHCAVHAKRHFQHDVCCQTTGSKHERRTWNRDVEGALNIGCLFLAQALGLRGQVRLGGRGTGWERWEATRERFERLYCRGLRSLGVLAKHYLSRSPRQNHSPEAGVYRFYVQTSKYSL